MEIGSATVRFDALDRRMISWMNRGSENSEGLAGFAN
jgi:hypothetical protein